MGTVDKIVDNVDDPESMTSAASATSSVTANAAQMPPDNQVSYQLK